jgi:hypothetical protein
VENIFHHSYKESLMNKGFSKVLLIAFVLFSTLSLSGLALAGPVNAQPLGKAPSHTIMISGNATFLTVEQGAALGIKPGMAGPNGVVPTIRVLSKGSIIPNSASGCNQNVCIYVTGSKLHVSDWSTTGYDANPTCTYAAYWVAGKVKATSNEVCGGSDTEYVSDWNDPGNFPNHTQLCNTWLHISGKPCETVHS